jgi:hypothetical protein
VLDDGYAVSACTISERRRDAGPRLCEVPHLSCHVWCLGLRAKFFLKGG